MSTGQTYYFRIDDFANAHGDDADLRFEGRSPQALADALQGALRSPDLFARWQRKQDAPDDVDMSLAATDPQASAKAEQADLHVDLTVTTNLSMRILRQRLVWLIGNTWTLRDVR